MTNVVAMLRGINVAGHKPINMADLRQSFEALGFDNVRTYLQSGNIVFTLPQRWQSKLLGRIEDALRADFGFSIPVFVRTQAEMESIVEGNPFLEKQGGDTSHLHVTFLGGPPPKAAVAKLAGKDAGSDEIKVVGREVYLHCPNGYGRTKLSNATIERVLGVPATTRNWRTTLALLELCRP